MNDRGHRTLGPTDARTREIKRCFLLHSVFVLCFACMSSTNKTRMGPQTHADATQQCVSWSPLRKSSARLHISISIFLNFISFKPPLQPHLPPPSSPQCRITPLPRPSSHTLHPLSLPFNQSRFLFPAAASSSCLSPPFASSSKPPPPPPTSPCLQPFSS